MTADQKDKSSSKASAFSARLLAVQAFYQMKQNGQAIRSVYQEFSKYRMDGDVGGQKIAVPDPKLFKQILFGVDERFVELEAVISANLHKDAKDRDVEPLLHAILLCGAYELLAQSEIDAPILINDYLNVGHAFYDKNEVALINGVLDSVAKVFR